MLTPAERMQMDVEDLRDFLFGDPKSACRHGDPVWEERIKIAYILDAILHGSYRSFKRNPDD